MALTPHDIGTRTFSRVSAGGVDRVEVADFLAAVARQTRDLQHQLDRAHEQVERLTAEVMRLDEEGQFVQKLLTERVEASEAQLPPGDGAG